LGLFIPVRLEVAITLRAQQVNKAAANLRHQLTFINCSSRTTTTNSQASAGLLAEGERTTLGRGSLPRLSTH